MQICCFNIIYLLILLSLLSSSSLHASIIDYKENQEIYNDEINKISLLLKSNYNNITYRKKIVLKRKIEESHCPRPQLYKENSIQIDVSLLNKVLSLDKNENENINIVETGAMISFENLVDELLINYNLIPAVVPEFKGITVGGSIQGLAAESTSLKYGFVHDAVIEFEVILSNGSIVICNKNINSDLFYGIPGSFGSIGIITKVKILCIHAESYIKLNIKSFNKFSDLKKSLISNHQKVLQNENNNNNNNNNNSIIISVVNPKPKMIYYYL